MNQVNPKLGTSIPEKVLADAITELHPTFVPALTKLVEYVAMELEKKKQRLEVEKFPELSNYIEWMETVVEQKRSWITDLELFKHDIIQFIKVFNTGDKKVDRDYIDDMATKMHYFINASPTMWKLLINRTGPKTDEQIAKLQLLIVHRGFYPKEVEQKVYDTINVICSMVFTRSLSMCPIRS